jgi:signal transduction histidine kinase
LDNAFNYTKPGDRISLKVWSDEKKHGLFFSVKDTGIGIPKHDQEHIFERFYRVEKGRARRNGGSGLGLSIAHKIIEAYRGNIELESQMNAGTSFQIMLPVLSNRN